MRSCSISKGSPLPEEYLAERQPGRKDAHRKLLLLNRPFTIDRKEFFNHDSGWLELSVSFWSNQQLLHLRHSQNR